MNLKGDKTGQLHLNFKAQPPKADRIATLRPADFTEAMYFRLLRLAAYKMSRLI